MTDSQTKEGTAKAVPTEGDLSEAMKGVEEFAFDDFQKSLTTESGQAVTRAEVAELKRTVGHIPALQSSIDRLIAQADAPSEDPKLKDLSSQVDALTEMLSTVIAPEDAVKLAASKDTNAMQSAISALGDRIEEAVKPSEEVPQPEAMDPIDPVQAGVSREWTLANEAIGQFAKANDVDMEANMDEWAPVFAEAQGANPNNVTEAMKFVMTKIAESSATIAAETRRSERAEAASGGSEGSRGSGGSGWDLTTYSGITAARKAGAITSDEFIQKWRDVT